MQLSHLVTAVPFPFNSAYWKAKLKAYIEPREVYLYSTFRHKAIETAL